MTSRTIDAWQGLVALVGVSAGVIPLGQFLVFGAAGSVWGWLFDGADGTVGWAGPLTVVVVAGVLVMVLERRGERSAR